MKNIRFILSALVLGVSLMACKKVEGPNGSSTIKGTVIIQKYNSLGQITAEYEAQEEDVYLIYGETNTFYDDDTKTSFDGSFEFNYLQNGKYQVFVYEDCASCGSGKQALITDVEITEKKSTQDLGTIYIAK